MKLIRPFRVMLNTFEGASRPLQHTKLTNNYFIVINGRSMAYDWNEVYATT